VFERTAQGYVILPDKLRVIDAARSAASAMERVDKLLRGGAASGLARIKVTSTDTLCQSILPRALSQIETGSAQIDLSCSNNHIDLSRMAADITVRPAAELPEDLTGDIVGHLAFGVYARRGCTPENWLRMNGPLGRSVVSEWMVDAVEPDQIVGGADSFVILKELAAHSNHRTVLPRCLAQGDARLEHLDIALPISSIPVWVASHRELSDVPHLNAIRSELVPVLRRLDDVLFATAA